jgi:hypothetical protein
VHWSVLVADDCGATVLRYGKPMLPNPKQARRRRLHLHGPLADLPRLSRVFMEVPSRVADGAPERDGEHGGAARRVPPQ